MDDPAEQEDPQGSRQNEKDQGYQNATLDELSQSGIDEASQCADDIACGTSTVHPRFLLVMMGGTHISYIRIPVKDLGKELPIRQGDDWLGLSRLAIVSVFAS